ncbi:MacB family efflux pump subunit [Govanella unica]|uniref:Pyoverdine export ATP-binding/permease protein PvdT n=1 Tax=Govanella unica TaxID=2975056 RepID=A0A9X3TYF4_9PROT|nr:MacB family efflux pump subunit [Govania unica]
MNKPIVDALQVAEPLLSLQSITRSYQSGETVIRALDGVGLSIRPGEFVAIMGQSGSGKSTLMNILGCLDQPTSGSYRVNGREAADLDADELASLRRETFGFIFQRYNLLATDTASENVEIPAVYAGMSREDRRARAQSLLGRLGLGDRTTHRPSELSGGQQQRVAIARALMNDAPVILADEPTGALDSRSGVEVLDLLKELHAEGKTILLITHDQAVADHAERIVVLRDGRIIEDGPNPKYVVPARPAALQAKPRPAHLGSGIDTATAVREAVHTAFRSLHSNIFRTALTLLGIIIGVAAVIAMLAIGDGSKQKVLTQMSAMGTNLMNVRPGAPGIRNSGDIVSLVPADADAIAALPNVGAVVAERSGRYTVRYGNLDYQTTAQGVTAAFPQVRDWPVAEGQFFSDRDVRGYAPVTLLGKTVAKNLFPSGVDPIGQYILVRNVPFEVIGIMTEKGASPGGNDQDDAIFIPVTTGMVRLFGKTYLSSLTVRVDDVKQIEGTQGAIEDLLKDRHRVEDFSVRNMASMLEMATETQNTLTLLLGVVAAISLLVGGIGVMNIMLVSVTERTREIGIRMATGARMRDILLQFNIEAAVVCAIGGLIGIFVGFTVGWVVSLFGMNVMFSLFPPLLAFGCAFATGVLFGYLPARKAARLDPVVALASE